MKNLSHYQLACGHVQEVKIGADKVELYEEFSAYHVRRFSDFIDGRKVQEYWQVFDTLKDARRAFSRQQDIAKAINKG